MAPQEGNETVIKLNVDELDQELSDLPSSARGSKSDGSDSSPGSNRLETLIAAREKLREVSEELDRNPTSSPIEEKRGEVSAATIGRMLGLVTASDFKLLEGKLDLISTRVNSVISKVERLTVLIGDSATGTDLERIDVQLSALRSLLQEKVDPAGSVEAESNDEKKDRPKRSIISNQPGSNSTTGTLEGSE